VEAIMSGKTKPAIANQSTHHSYLSIAGMGTKEDKPHKPSRQQHPSTPKDEGQRDGHRHYGHEIAHIPEASKHAHAVESSHGVSLEETMVKSEELAEGYKADKNA